MDAKLLTENGWKTIAAKFKVKDNGLQKALAAYEDRDQEDYDDCLKAVASISQLAAALKKAKDVSAAAAAAKYLADVASAADEAKAKINKAKATAAQKPAPPADSHEDDARTGDHSARLLAAFQTLKGGKDATYEFIVCDAKPVGVMVAKKITAQHKADLTNLTGSKKFFPVGTCSFQDGKFSFSLDKPITGLARKLQESIKKYTGKKLPIVAGSESADAGGDITDDTAAAANEAEAAPVQAVAPPKLPKPQLAKAPDIWHSTRALLDNNINAFKQAVMKAASDEPPKLIKQINANLSRLDGIMENLDTELAESLTKANAAKDVASRKAELKNSKRILVKYITYVKTEPLIAHVDVNPFGVQTNLKKVLLGSLTHMAQVIG